MKGDNTIQGLRDTLFETIEQVKSGKMEVEKAKTITNLASAIINSAKVETDYLKSINATSGTGFMDAKTKRLNA